MSNHKNLVFFNKEGDYLNFNYNESNERFEGDDRHEREVVPLQNSVRLTLSASTTEFLHGLLREQRSRENKDLQGYRQNIRMLHEVQFFSIATTRFFPREKTGRKGKTFPPEGYKRRDNSG